jgi:hypothetical protein
MFFQNKPNKVAPKIQSRDTIKTAILCGVAGAVMLFGGATTASADLAIPQIFIDLDPATPGIQNSLTVSQGSSFSVDVMLDPTNGFPTFDTFATDMMFNDQGPVLGLEAGTFAGNPVAGGIAIFCVLAICEDINTGGTVLIPGTPLTTGPLSSLQAPFANQLGSVGLRTLPAVPFIDLGLIDLFSVNFDALTAGTSIIRLLPPDLGPSNLTDPIGPEPASGIFGAEILFLGTTPVPADLFQGTVTVEAIPEPATLSLMGAGLLGVGAAALRRRKRKAQ